MQLLAVCVKIPLTVVERNAMHSSYWVLYADVDLCLSSIRGLLLPHVGVKKYGVERTDAGNLGSGIYFSDAFRFVGNVKIGCQSIKVFFNCIVC